VRARLQTACWSAMPVSMTDGDDAINEINALDAEDRALAIHEAGHAVVARALGAEVVFVEIDLATGNGGSRSSVFADNIKNLAVCVAGRKAEHAFAALALRSTRTEERSKHDLQQMENLLSRLPEAERCAARAASYRLAAENLTANADVVHRIADELLAREHIEGEELAALLAGAGLA
jgi:ATP-dependent Zn protease